MPAIKHKCASGSLPFPHHCHYPTLYSSASTVKWQVYVHWLVFSLWLVTSDYINLFRTATSCPVPWILNICCLLLCIWPRLFPILLPSPTCICLIVFYELCRPWPWISTTILLIIDSNISLQKYSIIYTPSAVIFGKYSWGVIAKGPYTGLLKGLSHNNFIPKVLSC